MSEKNNFADVQRLNSAVMAKCTWASSLIGMRKTGEEVHHRRTNTHRQANEFLQELLEQRSDGSSIDDHGVTDRYHKYLRTKSHLNDDSDVLSEFDRRLRALNANRMSKHVKPIDERLGGVRSLLRTNLIAGGPDQIMELQPRSSSKSTLNSNALSSLFSSMSQENISYTADEHPSSSSEESPASSVSHSTAKILPRAKAPQENDSEETKEPAVLTLNRDVSQLHAQPDDDSRLMKESSASSSSRSAAAQSAKSNVRHIGDGADSRESTTATSRHVVAEPSAQHVSNEGRMEESSSSLSDRSATEMAQKPNIRRLGVDEDLQQSTAPSINRTVTRTHVQHRKESSTSSSDRSVTKKIPKSAARQVNDSDETDGSSVFGLQRSTIITSDKPSTQQTDVHERAEQTTPTTSATSRPKTEHSDGSQLVRAPSASAAKRSIKKPSQKLSERQASDNETIKKASTKILPKPQLRQMNTEENGQGPSVSSSILPTAKTLYRPTARRPDGSELTSTSIEKPTRTASSDGSLFDQLFFPRSLLSREPVRTETAPKIVSSLLPSKQYDSTQLLCLLDSIETECSPVDFTAILDQLNLSSTQIFHSDSNISLNDDNKDSDGDSDENVPFISSLFEESTSSQDYYTTFTVNIDDPRKISLYTMTIGIVQLSPFRVVPYSILIGHRPLLQHSQQTNFKRVRCRRHKHTYRTTAVESFTNMEQVQENDIIVKINDQSVWNLSLDAVRSILAEHSRQSNPCLLTAARLCQPLI